MPATVSGQVTTFGSIQDLLRAKVAKVLMAANLGRHHPPEEFEDIKVDADEVVVPDDTDGDSDLDEAPNERIHREQNEMMPHDAT
ncbi:hypothetical protein LSAT2_008981 [Lamellibrachia satsuma]|nr:hypothetical protein LSAT2_008981 [Lamellibrachia satsuma]